MSERPEPLISTAASGRDPLAMPPRAIASELDEWAQAMADEERNDGNQECSCGSCRRRRDRIRLLDAASEALRA